MSCFQLGAFATSTALRSSPTMRRACEERRALIKYVLRPPIAQERVTAGPEGASMFKLQLDGIRYLFGVTLGEPEMVACSNARQPSECTSIQPRCV